MMICVVIFYIYIKVAVVQDECLKSRRCDIYFVIVLFLV